MKVLIWTVQFQFRRKPQMYPLSWKGPPYFSLVRFSQFSQFLLIFASNSNPGPLTGSIVLLFLVKVWKALWRWVWESYWLIHYDIIILTGICLFLIKGFKGKKGWYQIIVELQICALFLVIIWLRKLLVLHLQPNHSDWVMRMVFVSLR